MKRTWIDTLPSDVAERLADCRTRRSDLPALVNAKWADMVKDHKNEQGFTKEDALINILELLDCNGIDFDPTRDEYEKLIS